MDETRKERQEFLGRERKERESKRSRVGGREGETNRKEREGERGKRDGGRTGG